jgi:hypothetical protein
MAWTTPKTWSVGELVTASDMNTHLRDNLNALKTPPSAHYVLDQASEYTTTSTSFVDVDATNLSSTITTNGGDVMVIFSGVFNHNTNGAIIFLNLSVDGANVQPEDGIVSATLQAANRSNIVLFYMVTGLPAGSHTFRLRWKTSSGVATLHAGATAPLVHSQWIVREIS